MLHAEQAWQTLGKPRAGVVIIDGRSGSGKTSLAASLAPLMGAAILHMDDLYEGWHGFLAAPDTLVRALETGRYRRYDWHLGALAETRELDRDTPLIIEGCGSLTRTTLDAAAVFGGQVLSVWLECPLAVRKSRAIARDGQVFAPYWEDWAQQEAAHMMREAPEKIAGYRFSTAPT
nr:hypothetical protein [Leucobacter chinensis]